MNTTTMLYLRWSLKLLPKKSWKERRFPLKQSRCTNIFWPWWKWRGAMHSKCMPHQKLPGGSCRCVNFARCALAVMDLPVGVCAGNRECRWYYGVGVDIGCRMCLSIFDIDVGLTQREAFFTRELGEATLFGSGCTVQHAEDHGDGQ